MEKEALLKLNELVERYARHRGYIERAQSQVSKFSASVVEKVIHDHEARSLEVAREVLPLVPQIEEMIAAILDEQARVSEEKTAVHDQMEELELRLAIGEIEEGEFDNATRDFRAAIADADGRLSALGQERDELSHAIDRWSELARAAGQADGRAGSAPAPAAPEPAPAPPPAATTAQQAAVVQSAPPPAQMSIPPVTTSSMTVVPEEEIVRNVREDLSEILGAQAPVIVNAPEDEIEAAIEAADVNDEEIMDEASADVDFGFDDGGASQDLLRRNEGSEVELDLVEDGDTSLEGGDLSADASTGPAQVDTHQAISDEPRRALLLYQEGTAEEQIYPFTGEVLTIGRGRDNDIQIKNDSKVSRFHCKLFRRSGNFYIEDNKSSNGTLVNGELITERRLFGGEEVIIGETFFRFRIL